MKEKTNFQRFYERIKFGFKVSEAFDEREINTIYRQCALLELYDALDRGKEMPRQKLKEAIGMKNNSQFTNSVLNPLIKEGYVEVSRGRKTIVSLASLGEGLVDDVMEKFGY